MSRTSPGGHTTFSSRLSPSAAAQQTRFAIPTTASKKTWRGPFVTTATLRGTKARLKPGVCVTDVQRLNLPVIPQNEPYKCHYRFITASLPLHYRYQKSCEELD